MTETKGVRSWFQKQVDNAVRKDEVPKEELIGMIIGVICVVIMIAFFAIHQTRPTGFFTSEFGDAQAVLLYLLIAFGLVPQVMRIVTRRKSQSRLFDIIGSVLFVIAVAYFLFKFPFDFTHFKDPLPRVLEPLLGWVSDDIAKALMALGLVIAAASIPYQFMLYWFSRQKLPEVSKEESETAQPPSE